ncbi:MAG: M64 family metallopeptidase [Myxococcota bacterium]|nr:M64 family metallopeptidase [Myxococcota bacterium]
MEVGKIAAVVLISLLGGVATRPARAADPIQQPLYTEFFTDAALRVDLVHSGTRGKEIFGIEEIVAEPMWPGTRTYLIDTIGFGKYRFRVFDHATGREIFSQGYCTLMGEWMTTPESATGVWRSMSEPIRMPYPKAAITLAIELRDAKKGTFKELQRLDIDPTAYDVRREKKYAFETEDLINGASDPAHMLDIVIVPDGYTAEEVPKMAADAKRFAEAFFTFSPFDRNKDKIAVRLVKAISKESGPDEPRKGIFRNTVVDTTFDTFRAPRYLTTSNMKALREVAALVPYDTIFVMVNASRYGGGGVFNSFSIFTSDTEYSEYVMIHEFGHGFGALADEYFDAATGTDVDVFYEKGAEPWEPNITAATRRKDIKWGHLISSDVPIPTPDLDKYDGVVGLFEGAGYRAKGLFRSTRDSKMFHKGLLPFGPVSEAAIEEMIQYYTDAEVGQ